MSIENAIENYFDDLSDKVIKLLIEKALSERDKRISLGGKENELLGSWGVIIDAIKFTTMKRRERAAENLQMMCSVAYSEGNEALDKSIAALKQQKMIDRILVDAVRSSLDECRSAQNGVLCDILQHILDNLMDTKAVQANDVKSNDDQYLIASGKILNEILRTSAGNVPKLKTEVLTLCSKWHDEEKYDKDEGQSVSMTESFIRVINDNIDACHKAGYNNKLKVLEYIVSVVNDFREGLKRPDTSLADEDNGGGTMPSSAHHHAPQFIDTSQSADKEEFEIEVGLVDESDGYIDVSTVSSALLKGNVKNTKKKNLKQAAKRKIGTMSENAGRHLQENGWAVLDHVLPEDLIRRVRVEAGIFSSKYEQSEIWVGKQADIGAQLSVPSVRGDKVLWMCGGHRSHAASAPEGVTRTVRQAGEVEPCRLDIKASAPIRIFSGIKELMAAVDLLVYDLRAKVPKLAGLYERSDAMLALYPGEGARFARHIDNTTGDGRRLTVLVYLNPDWTHEMGGALRLFPVTGSSERHKAIDIYPEAGRLAMFYSAEVAHEVLPTFGQRHAITLWYYDADERKIAVEQALKEGSGSTTASRTSEASQREAKEFIAVLMGGDEVGGDGGDPSVEELAELAHRVENLSEDALKMVASITGAPSPESFRAGFPLLSTVDLKSMRALFRRMGLGKYSTV